MVDPVSDDENDTRDVAAALGPGWRAVLTAGIATFITLVAYIAIVDVRVYRV